QMHATSSLAPPPRRADDLAARYASETVRSLFPTGGLGRAPARQESLGLGDRAERARAGEALTARDVRTPAGAAAGTDDPWDVVRARVAARDAARGGATRPEAGSASASASSSDSASGSASGSGSGSGSASGSASASGSGPASASSAGSRASIGAAPGSGTAPVQAVRPHRTTSDGERAVDGPPDASSQTRGPTDVLTEAGAGAGAATEAGRDGSEGPGFFASLRYLGQLDRTYLVCEGDGEMVLIDQHAAHERVEFQRLRERAAADGVAVQRLLFPTTLELPAAERALVADGADLLAAVGFDVEPFGGTAVAVKAVPAGLRQDPAGVLRELLAELVERGGSRAVDERLEHVLATVACHSVVRAGDVLAADEVRALLGQMDGVDFRAHCPHGRPVLLRVGIAELARRFGRT
ncbi:MAG TPA: hypothetical protein VHE35_22045, partial [Kofleriaceae bacterium]|nr:hypothetical protein [Kofleriaceae bacterium]